MFFLQTGTRCLQIRQHILKVLCIRIHAVLCVLNDAGTQPKFLGDGERIALARNAQEKPIGRAQCRDIKLAAGIFHIRCLQGIKFEFTVVGRGHDNTVTAVQICEDRCGQSGTFHRIRSGTKLIKQNQTVLIGFVQDGDRIDHVGRESTQTLLNALFVANVCVDFLKDSKAGAIKCRNMQTRLSHQCKKSYRLQRDSFAAGVGAGHDQ